MATAKEETEETSSSVKMVVTWLNIEDESPTATPVWLEKQINETYEQWKPLRKIDCLALNNNNDNNDKNMGEILIECGRSTAYYLTDSKIIKYNYVNNRPIRMLTKATWFYKLVCNDDKNKHMLVPINENNAKAIEELYQRAIQEITTTTTTTSQNNKSSSSLSSLGEKSGGSSGIENLLKETLPVFNLDDDSSIDDNYHIMLQKTNEGQLIIRKCQKGNWLLAGIGGGKSIDIQRGYGQYEIEGESDEQMLGPVSDLIYIIHGIGEQLWSRDDFTYTNSMNEDIDTMRLKVQKQQIIEWQNRCKVAQKQNQPEPSPPGRIELIPIFWYDRIHSSSSELMRSLQAVTLNTIPALREIANDVIFDVLMYLTPNFCYDVLECVTTQICEVQSKFVENMYIKQQNHDNSNINPVQFSLMGHSLGSVICWDLLSILKEEIEKSKKKVGDSNNSTTKDTTATTTEKFAHNDIGYQHYASEENANKAKNGSWGPSLPQPLETSLPFTPKFTIFLGSPIGLFLTLRGAHPVFEELRDVKNNNYPVSLFTLPSKSIRNIFNPSDPVAYRIESLLLPQGTKHLPPPLYLTRQGESVRLHVKAKQFGDELYKSITSKQKSISSIMSNLTEQASKALQQSEEKRKAEDEDGKQQLATASKSDDDDNSLWRFPLAGTSANGRIDFQLQPRIIDNEYISCVTAHVGYWANTDVIEYVIDLAQNQNEAVK